MFKNLDHELFYKRCLEKTPNDVFHQALFYTLGILDVTQKNVESLYDFKKEKIVFEGLSQGWQTGASKRITRMAFNLFNGFAGMMGDEKLEDGLYYTPYYIFDMAEAPYLMEAIKIRYPEYSACDTEMKHEQENEIVCPNCGRVATRHELQYVLEDGCESVSCANGLPPLDFPDEEPPKVTVRKSIQLEKKDV